MKRSIQVTPVLLVLAAVILGGCAGNSPVRRQDIVFFPAAPDTARFQFLTRIYDSGNIQSQGVFNKLVMGEQAAFHLAKPYGVLMTGGTIYLVDTQLAGLVRIDLEKKKMGLLRGIDQVPLQSPINISSAGDGKKLLCDTKAGRILVLDEEDHLAGIYGDGESFIPLDAAVFGENLYVVDKKSKGVLVLDRTTGEKVRSLNADADSAGGLFFPTNVAVAPNGNVYVTDTVRCRVYCFDQDGEYLFGFGKRGDTVGAFARPKGIDVNKDGLVFVVDAAFENAQVFTPEGVPLTFIGGPGRRPGQFFLPAGIALAYGETEYLKKYIHPGVEVDYVVLVASQFGPAHVDIFGAIANVDEFVTEYPPELGYRADLADTTKAPGWDENMKPIEDEGNP